MITGNIIWASIRNFNELKIPFEDGVMEFSFGGAFYICLITGLLLFFYAMRFLFSFRTIKSKKKSSVIGLELGSKYFSFGIQPVSLCQHRGLTYSVWRSSGY